MPDAESKKASQNPAVTPREIASRLFTVARGLERQVTAEGGVDVAEIEYLAKKLRVYARRLRESPATYAARTYAALDLTSTHRVGQSPTARVRIRALRDK
jgi:hypothetical protein